MRIYAFLNVSIGTSDKHEQDTLSIMKTAYNDHCVDDKKATKLRKKLDQEIKVISPQIHSASVRKSNDISCIL